MPSKQDPQKISRAPSVFAAEIDDFTSASKLSRRERDIVVALIRNITNSEEIAKALGISTHTVNNHLKSIFEKTSTKSKTEILSSFLRYAADKLQSRNLFVRRPKVLVIDDESIICDFVASGLRDHGLKTYTLTEPERAVSVISTLNVDFVVCDLRMPSMNGIDVLKSVRGTFKCWPHFVFLTGYPDYSIEEFMHLGAAGFIEKPLDIDHLFRVIMGHLADSSDERVAMLQIDASSPVVVDTPCQLGEGELGFGGAFVQLDANTQKKARIGVGSVVDLTLAPARSEAMLKVRGQVVWKRPSKEGPLLAGLGVKFLAMSDRDQGVFESLVRDGDLTSFIPMGGMPAGVLRSVAQNATVNS